MTVAKSLASGLPIGACVAGGDAAEVLAAGRPRLDLRRRPAGRRGGARDARRARRRRAARRACACSATACAPGSSACAARAASPTCAAAGLMVGADLPPSASGEAPAVVREALGARIVLNATGPDTLRFLPPLIDRASERRRPRARASWSEAL